MPVTMISAKPAAQPATGNFRFIDIGGMQNDISFDFCQFAEAWLAVNLTDPVFRGYHHGRKKHDDDLEAMLERSRAAGVKSMIITGGSLHESREALELAKQFNFYATVGCHPTRSRQFDQFKGGPNAYLEELDKLIEANLDGNGRVVAVGECGLGLQLSLAKKHHLPLFLHSRAAHADFVSILREEGFGEDGGRGVGANGGVVHSFTGTAEEVTELMDMGFHISLNGCSLKTEANLAAAKAIRPDKIMFETGEYLTYGCGGGLAS
ncbi:hypothetical protein PHLCEN_2v8274 [Hermanssonia centrifuga]|uniref:Uncharacterized protein n=1 Tax=Hermanssonia centrifuga TaxID=98765 RepID=A0A2R6NU25_9APHY|nr:hypothetical protein PHLCEN_2v8274 [Hermanssonia centrifuga]